MKALLLFLLIVFNSQVLFSQTCESLFGDNGKEQKNLTIAEKVQIFPLETKLWGLRLIKHKHASEMKSTSTEKQNEILADIMRMMGSTLHFNASEKLTFDKGKIVIENINFV